MAYLYIHIHNLLEYSSVLSHLGRYDIGVWSRRNPRICSDAHTFLSAHKMLFISLQKKTTTTTNMELKLKWSKLGCLIHAMEVNGWAAEKADYLADSGASAGTTSFWEYSKQKIQNSLRYKTVSVIKETLCVFSLRRKPRVLIESINKKCLCAK